jgi:hypothetical protein
MRRVFIPTALWVFFRQIGHANTQLRDLVMDTAWRGHNTLIIRKSGSIRARNGPKRRKRKKKKEKKILIYVVFRATLHECLSVSLRFWRSQAEDFRSYFFFSQIPGLYVGRLSCPRFTCINGGVANVLKLMISQFSHLQ